MAGSVSTVKLQNTILVASSQFSLLRSPLRLFMGCTLFTGVFVGGLLRYLEQTLEKRDLLDSTEIGEKLPSLWWVSLWRMAWALDTCAFITGIGEIAGRSHPLRSIWVELNIDRNLSYPTKTVHDQNMAYELQRYLYAAWLYSLIPIRVLCTLFEGRPRIRR